PAQATRVVFDAARRVGGTSLLLAAAGGVVTSAYLLHVGTYGTASTIVTLVAIVFAWGAWMGFGQVVTRSLVLHGRAPDYAHAAMATATASLLAAWWLGRSVGAVGAALAIAVPHSLMIGWCAWMLSRGAARTDGTRAEMAR